LEGQAEKEVIAHAEELRARATSTRAVDHDLNRLWLSINQTSSRLVTVGPQVAPKAIEYHDALAQSSKQASSRSGSSVCTRPAQKQPQRLPEPPTPHHSRLSHLLQTWQSQREVL
jgi:hypothetical protein